MTGNYRLRLLSQAGKGNLGPLPRPRHSNAQLFAMLSAEKIAGINQSRNAAQSCRMAVRKETS
jgi:hypothetical protein